MRGDELLAGLGTRGVERSGQGGGKSFKRKKNVTGKGGVLISIKWRGWPQQN